MEDEAAALAPEPPKALAKKAPKKPAEETTPEQQEIALLRARIAELEAAAKPAPEPAKDIAPVADDFSAQFDKLLEGLGRFTMAALAVPAKDAKELGEKYKTKITGALEGAAEGALTRFQDGNKKK